MKEPGPGWPDPLRREVALSYTLALPVLGVPVRFESTSAAVIRIAEEAYGGWRVLLNRPDLIADDQVRIRVFVEEVDAPLQARPAMVYRLADPDRVVLRTRGCVGVTDVARRDGVAWVDPALVADRETFRYAVLEAMTQSVLTFLDRMPMHAAAIERDGTALLLAGPSGSGKSTLTYAAARCGFRVLAEDLVFVQSVPDFRVWGLPGYIHLPLTARDRFPDLAETLPRLLANGKEKIAVPLAGIGAMPDLPVVPRAGICVLARASGAPQLSRVTGHTLEKELSERLEPGFDRFRESVGDVIRHLARHGGWRLALSPDPAEALPYIERMFEAIEAATLAVD